MALSSSLVSLGVLVGIFSLLALGLNIKFGYTGLLDIGHVAFFLVGAYLTALLVAPPPATQQFGDYILGWGWPWIPALAAGTVAAGVLGLLVALPAIRLREDYLAISVLGISVILRRIVQSEGWLANGPDSLRGYPLPLRSYFPLPDGTELATVFLFGLVIAIFWTVVAYLLAQYLAGDDPAPGPLARAAFALTTLGVGYFAAGAARRPGDRPDAGIAGAGGLVAGLVGAASVYVGLGELATLAFFGAASVFSWVFAAALVGRYFGDLTPRDVATGVGLSVAFILPFMPVALLGQAGVFPTLALLIIFVYGVYYLATNWTDLGGDAPFVRVLGVAAISLFLVRYFPLALVGPLTGQGLGSAVSELVQNVLWLVNFTAAGPEFDYSRFLLAGTFATVGLVYYLLERTVNSPFGRVLKAIREDEDVATSLGKNVFSYKVQSMVLGSAIAGLAGGLYAIQIGALTHTLFLPQVTFIAFLIVVIGGVADNRGAILGAFIFWAFRRGTSDIAGFFPTGTARSSVQALRLAVFGALFIIILYYRPGGILGDDAVGTQGGG